jgi:hypothetical protein
MLVWLSYEKRGARAPEKRGTGATKKRGAKAAPWINDFSFSY